MTLFRFIRVLTSLLLVRVIVGLLVVSAGPAISNGDELVQRAQALTNLSGLMLVNVVILSAAAIGTTIVLINDHRQ